jgi:hypothetical protein
MHKYTTKQVEVFSGTNAMDLFLKFLMNYKGVLWFFYGARFDAHFVLKYCIENAYAMDPDSLLFTGTNLLSFKIKTNVGWIELKDMWRFTPDRLDKTCKAYEIPVEFAKTSFQFDKVKNWKEFEKHKEEMDVYIRQDVLAMAHVFTKYSETCFLEYGCIASKFMTRSHFTYGIWTTICKPHLMAQLYKTPLEFMDYTRSFYRGGRVFCGRPTWQSQNWMKLLEFRPPGIFPILLSQEEYDAIDDFLVYTDVNSLYPSVMVNIDYPIEKFEFRNFDDEEPEDETSQTMHLLTLRRLMPCWKLWAAEVSVICPNNLNVPFLMERNEKSEVHQTLLPKRAWWTGPELLEAVELGYVIERIHKVMKWPKGGDLFTEFITRTYDKKCNAPKDGPIYCVNKQFMNDLTGKFFQKVICTSKKIVYNPNEIQHEKVYNITEITGDEGRPLAWFYEVAKDDTHASFPAHLSAFILGWSKVAMSRMRTALGIQTDPFHCPWYEDTDSIICHNSAWMKLDPKHKQTKAKELGRLKLELEGKIIALYVLAPKTYMVLYVEAKTKAVYMKLRAKGIPVDREIGDYLAFFKIPAPNSEKMLKVLSHLQSNAKRVQKEPVPVDFVDIKDRAYFFKNLVTQKTEILERIPADYFMLVAEKKMELVVLFGSMLRKFDCNTTEEMFIMPQYRHRQVGKTDWWTTGRRLLNPDAEQWETAYPPGHQLFSGSDL